MEAAFFDLDKTIIAKSSVLAFGKSFYREGLLSRTTIAKSIYAQVVYMLVGADEQSMEKLRTAMLGLTRGWERGKIEAIVADAMNEVIEPIVFREALDLFDEHHAAGRRVVVVSSSPIEIVRPLVKYLGVDDCIATEAEIDDDGRYTGELAFYAYGPHKSTAIRQYAEEHEIDLEGSYAYSDSITDVPMLECVGHPVPVNADKELARYAKDHDWELQRFTSPMRIKRKVPVPPKGPTIAVGSAIGLAAISASIAWNIAKRSGPRLS
ncbi:MAG: HAD family hydrolase [Acidimicrobiia bacterium]